ncbi:MAG: response regulator [Bacteriovorax sp.]|nr:response regulator [Bacteriovorax sp.]
MKVLVVDDSPAIFTMVSLMLEDRGHNSVWAEDGVQAVSILAATKGIDIILLDWNMPNMNGLEFLEKNVKENFTNIPIIIMSGENSPSFIKKVQSLSVSEFIVKPFSQDVLFNTFSLANLMHNF